MTRTPAAAMSPSDLQQITHFLQLVTDTNWPGHKGAELTVRAADGRQAVLLIPPYRFPPPAVPADDDLTEMERNILDALAEADSSDPPTGEQLARVAGYEFSGTFRKALAALVRSGRVVNNRPGYSLPP